MYRNTYALIDLNKMGNNVSNIIEYYSDYKYYIGVVKANAYGFGYGIIKTLEKNGINYFAVSTIEEALEVRSKTKLPILILEPINLEFIDLCIEKNFTITLSNYDDYKVLCTKAITNLKIHIKVDSGMHRLGFTDKNIIKEVYLKLKDNIEGVYTHLATTGINDKKYDNQIDNFVELTSLIDLSNIKMVHVGRSSTLLNHDKLDFVNSIRLGILMYGIKPNDLKFNGFKGFLRKIKRNRFLKKNNISNTITSYKVDVSEPFKLVSEVIEIKKVLKNEFVGYGLQNKLENDSIIGIVCVGYADGLSLNNTGRSVLINDKKYEIVGSINSGMIMVKINENVKIHDKVIVIDSVSSVAKYTGETPYKVTSSILENVERIYINE